MGRGFTMMFRIVVGLIGTMLAAPAFAWSGSALAGDYRVTANIEANRLSSILVTPPQGVGTTPMQIHAWFVDGEGAILGEAPLANAMANGAALVASGKSAPIPAHAAALVVMAQPARLARAAAIGQPALIAQIALR